MTLFNQQEKIIDALSSVGWVVIDDFLEATLCQNLQSQCDATWQSGRMSQAGIGRANALSVQKNIRGDHIQWLEMGDGAASDAYLMRMNALRERLNETLFLGLESSEHHFAVYPSGSFYQRHLDRFKDDDRRTISSVFYLNATWQESDAGQLRIDSQGQQHDIAPLANRLVLFVSAEIWHEVLPTNAIRKSLTGWFKRR